MIQQVFDIIHGGQVAAQDSHGFHDGTTDLHRIWPLYGLMEAYSR